MQCLKQVLSKRYLCRQTISGLRDGDKEGENGLIVLTCLIGIYCDMEDDALSLTLQLIRAQNSHMHGQTVRVSFERSFFPTYGVTIQELIMPLVLLFITHIVQFLMLGSPVLHHVQLQLQSFTRCILFPGLMWSFFHCDDITCSILSYLYPFLCSYTRERMDDGHRSVLLRTKRKIYHIRFLHP